MWQGSVSRGGKTSADVLVGLRMRVVEDEQGRSFREGSVTRVKPVRGGGAVVRLRVDRRVVERVEVTRFERTFEFSADVLMSRVEVDWNGAGLSRRPALEDVREPAAAIV
jgi:hypothetical protein